VEACSFEKIQLEADLLSIHVPLTEETRNYFTLDLFKGFSKPIYLINTARGEVISFETLNLAFNEGILRGAVLDVLENEKFENFSAIQKVEFEKLAARPNVLFSPHIAGWTFQSYEKINQVLVEKIKMSAL
jgi:D-3-phosphoglycerate dehydrogenase